MAYPDPAGFGTLWEAIAGYLATSGGIVCSPEQILVTPGYQGALDLIARVLIRRNDDVWLEDPCYPRARAALEAAGAKLVLQTDIRGVIGGRSTCSSPKACLLSAPKDSRRPKQQKLTLGRKSFPRRQGTSILSSSRYGVCGISDGRRI
jgi:GntR family transcriptional regulator / MocR family aminotransferase